MERKEGGKRYDFQRLTLSLLKRFAHIIRGSVYAHTRVAQSLLVCDTIGVWCLREHVHGR